MHVLHFEVNLDQVQNFQKSSKKLIVQLFLQSPIQFLPFELLNKEFPILFLMLTRCWITLVCVRFLSSLPPSFPNSLQFVVVQSLSPI